MTWRRGAVEMKMSFYILRSQHLKEGILQESKLCGEDLREEPCVDGETHPERPHVSLRKGA